MFTMPLPTCNWRTNEAIDLQSVKTDCRADNVDDRIERTDLVKVNVIDGLIVYAGFCFGKTRENLHRTLFHRVGQSGAFDDLFDIR